MKDKKKKKSKVGGECSFADINSKENSNINRRSNENGKMMMMKRNVDMCKRLI